MKNAIIAILALSTLAIPEVKAEMTYAEKAQICAAANAANAEGVSAEYLLREIMASEGQPTYMAKVLLNEAKSLCPRVY